MNTTTADARAGAAVAAGDQERAHERGRERGQRRAALRSRAWSSFLLVVGPVAAATLVLPSPWSTRVWVVVQVAATIMAVQGLRWNGLARLAPWRLLAGSVALGLLSTLLTGGVGHTALTLQYATVALGCLLLGRGPDESWWVGLLDTSVLTVGLAIPYLTLVVDPLIDSGIDTAPGYGFIAASPILALFVLFAVFRMALARPVTPWLGLVIFAAAINLLGDTIRLVILATGELVVPVASMAWLGWSIILTAALLHPSAAGAATGDRPTTSVESGRAMISVIAGVTLLSPLLSTVLKITLETDTVRQTYDEVVIALLTALLATLLVARLVNVVRLVRRRAAELDRQADRLTEQARELNDSLGRQRELQERLSYRAQHDPLTGLVNRAVLHENLARVLIRRTAPQERPPALMMLDLDGFKEINDTLGHPVGDDLLIQVAGRLTGLAPPGATVARLGGDEFAVLLPGTGPGDAAALADQALQALRAPYPHSDHELHLTTSIGLLAGLPIRDPADAMRDADLALYAAKNAGKNRVSSFDTALGAAQIEHSRLISGLRAALPEDRLSLEFQPIVRLSTREVRAVEALLRWTPQEGRPVSPDKFIPVAEETGLIVPIGAWVLDRACVQVAPWHGRYGISFGVNVSGRQLYEDDFGTMVMETLDRHGLPPTALVLEITESMLLSEVTTDTARVVNVLSQLRDEGVRVALDDFGTGYSSLSYLRFLPVDFLKIDRSFVATLDGGDNQRTLAFTQAIVDLAANLDVDTVAEGVETGEQAEVLEQMGCGLAQGHFFSAAMPARKIERLLLRSLTPKSGSALPPENWPEYRPEL